MSPSLAGRVQRRRPGPDLRRSDTINPALTTAVRQPHKSRAKAITPGMTAIAARHNAKVRAAAHVATAQCLWARHDLGRPQARRAALRLLRRPDQRNDAFGQWRALPVL